MNLPDGNQWLRVEELADELGRLPVAEAAARLATLAAEGESPTVLTMVSGWLALPPLPAPLGPGDLVGTKYVLRQKLGEGGMGSVWRAKQDLIEREVALKMIHPSLVTPALRERFVSEMKILGQLDHPGIVKIFDAGVHETSGGISIPFLVMELVEGEPLDYWANAHHSEVPSLLKVVADICEAVQSAHERGIVHRDLKPANILVRRNHQPVILDFGIARLAGIVVGEESGLFSGTPQYAAPEQHTGKDHDFRSGESVDVYALGAILFEMLAGRRLFKFPREATVAEIRRTVLEDPPTRLNEVLPNCPPWLDEITARAVRRNPADRFYSVAALGRAISRCASLINPPAAPPPPWGPAAGALIPGTGWRLKEKIGEGGVGQVWTGVNEQVGQLRVFKFCDTEEKARTLKRELTLFRLLKERVGRNPHFIQLHEVSLDEPPWYLMMDHSEARELELWCQEQPGGLAALPEALRIEIMAQVAEALQAAHEAGILHRDIKPSNVQVRAAPSPPSVHVLIADFGIGQIITDEWLNGSTRLGFTHTVLELRRGTLSGTMIYMAPEVLEGSPATVRSDIYSLGVLLWQMLSGNLQAALDPADWHERIQDPLLRDDLTRCLAGAPGKRWASAGELAASLRALPERRSATARRRADLARREREAYRRGVIRTAGVAVFVVAMIAGLAGIAWVKSREADKQRKAVVLSQTSNGLLELKALAELNSTEARARLEKLLPELNIQEAGLKQEFQTVASQIYSIPVFEPLSTPPFQLKESDRFSDTGLKLVTAPTQTQPAKVQELASGFGLSWPLPPDSGSTVKVNETGRAAGTIRADGSLQVSYGGSLETNRVFPGPIQAGCFALSPTILSKSRLQALAVARPDGSVEVFPLEKSLPSVVLLRRSTQTKSEYPESCPATAMSFCRAQGGLLAVAGRESLYLWFWKIRDQAAEGWTAELAGALAHPGLISCFRWNPISEEIATGSDDGLLRVWRFAYTRDSPQTDPVRETDLGGPIQDVTWSSDGKLLAVLSSSGSIRILQAQNLNGRVVKEFSHPGAAHLSFVPGSVLVAWGPTGTRAWGSPEEPFFVERFLAEGAIQVAFHEAGALTGMSAKLVSFLNPITLASTASYTMESLHPAVWLGDTLVLHTDHEWKTSVMQREAGEHTWLRMSLAPLPAKKADLVFASSRGKREARWLDGQLECLTEGQVEGKPATVMTAPHFLAVSDSSALTAWPGIGNEVILFDHLAGKESTFTLSDPALGLAISPTAGLLACRHERGVTFIDLQSHEQTDSPLPAPGTEESPLAFSPDGRWLAVIGPNDSLLLAAIPSTLAVHQRDLWPELFKQPAILPMPTRRRIVSLCWNSAGNLLAAGSADGYLQSWNVSLLREKLRLYGLDWGKDPPPKAADFVPVRF